MKRICLLLAIILSSSILARGNIFKQKIYYIADSKSLTSFQIVLVNPTDNDALCYVFVGEDKLATRSVLNNSISERPVTIEGHKTKFSYKCKPVVHV